MPSEISIWECCMWSLRACPNPGHLAGFTLVTIESSNALLPQTQILQWVRRCWSVFGPRSTVIIFIHGYRVLFTLSKMSLLRTPYPNSNSEPSTTKPLEGPVQPDCGAQNVIPKNNFLTPAPSSFLIPGPFTFHSKSQTQ